MKKVGIITFHNSYNCGSMLESYAMQKAIEKRGCLTKIIDFSNYNQRKLYSIFYKNNSLKNIVKNILVIPAISKLKVNNKKYEEFKRKNFNLTSDSYISNNQLSDEEFDIVVSGSDQIWNITIEDSDDAYFLPWVKKAKKVAYAPSFGSKNILKYSKEPEKYKEYINSYDYISIRENNGKKWIRDLCNRDAEVLIDPTLLLNAQDYDAILEDSDKYKGDYIFFYCPSFNTDICKFVKKISEKYNLKVIAWSTKSYYFKQVKKYGFELVDYETPALYLSLIKNAKVVITTSFHGTIFSTIYKKNFITVKNGDMYGDDDRVITLLKQLNMMDRLIPFDFDEKFDYLADVDYSSYDKTLDELKDKANNFLDIALFDEEKNENNK